MNKAAALAIWTGTRNPKRPTDLGFILWMPGHFAKFVLPVSELALGTIAARSFLLPAPA